MKLWKLLLSCSLVFCASFAICRFAFKAASTSTVVSASLASAGIASFLLDFMVRDLRRQVAKGFKN